MKIRSILMHLHSILPIKLGLYSRPYRLTKQMEIAMVKQYAQLQPVLSTERSCIAFNDQTLLVRARVLVKYLELLSI